LASWCLRLEALLSCESMLFTVYSHWCSTWRHSWVFKFCRLLDEFKEAFFNFMYLMSFTLMLPCYSIC
jgi:hypothetical protein